MKLKKIKIKNNRQKFIFFVFFIFITLAFVKAHAHESFCSLFFKNNPRYFALDALKYLPNSEQVNSRAPLNNKSLLEAYSVGIFPWGVQNNYVKWFNPKERAVLNLNKFKLKKSHERQIKNLPYKITTNKAFAEVIQASAQVQRKEETSTWISPEIIDAFIEFHKAGYAHSVEVWENNKLIGGLYGVLVNGVFFGESMFHLKPNASKLALIHLIHKLKDLGVQWLDSQEPSPLIMSIGGEVMPREEFENILRSLRSNNKARKWI